MKRLMRLGLGLFSALMLSVLSARAQNENNFQFKYDGLTVAIHIQDIGSTNWLYITWIANQGDFQKTEGITTVDTPENMYSTYKNFKVHVATSQKTLMYLMDGPPWEATSNLLMKGVGSCTYSYNEAKNRVNVNVQGTFVEAETGDLYSVSVHRGWQNK